MTNIDIHKLVGVCLLSLKSLTARQFLRMALTNIAVIVALCVWFVFQKQYEIEKYGVELRPKDAQFFLNMQNSASEEVRTAGFQAIPITQDEFDEYINEFLRLHLTAEMDPDSNFLSQLTLRNRDGFPCSDCDAVYSAEFLMHDVRGAARMKLLLLFHNGHLVFRELTMHLGGFIFLEDAGGVISRIRSQLGCPEVSACSTNARNGVYLGLQWHYPREESVPDLSFELWPAYSHLRRRDMPQSLRAGQMELVVVFSERLASLGSESPALKVDFKPWKPQNCDIKEILSLLGFAESLDCE